MACEVYNTSLYQSDFVKETSQCLRNRAHVLGTVKAAPGRQGWRPRYSDCPFDNIN